MQSVASTEARKFMKSQTRLICCHNTQEHMFLSLFIFRGHSALDPAASIGCGDEQSDPFHSAGQHGKLRQPN